MKILTFCMTYRLSPEVVNALTRQTADYFDTHFTNDNPHTGEFWGGYRNMMLNWQKMEKLAEGYDKVWIVEDDTIPPDDALEKLLEVDGDVVNGLFAHRHASYDPSLLKAPNVSYTWEEIRKFGNQTITVQGSATGCTLLSRKFLDRYKIDMTGYHKPKESGYQKVAQDILLSTFCRENGIEQKARLDVQCGHVKAGGEIIWPEQFMRIVI